MIRFNPHLMSGMVLCLAGASAAAGNLTALLADYQKAVAEGKASTRLDIDNDSLLLNRDDGLYSSGLRLSRQYALQHPGGRVTYGWRIGQELYTASDINLPPQQIAASEHPYAGWLYGGLFKQVQRDDGTRLTWGIDVGCLGPCAGGEATQTALHRLLSQPLPQGWSRQVRNEWGMILHAKMAPVSWRPTPWLQATPVLHGRFGNIYTDAGGGIALQAGQLPTLGQPAGIHVFLHTDVRAVAYNATLQGGYFSSDNPHTVAPKRMVAEAELGLAWRSGPYGVTGSIIRRSSEIRALSNGQGAQNFARLLITYAP